MTENPASVASDEVIEVPHPVTIPAVRIVERTEWRYADDCQPDEKTGKLCVQACVAEYQELDDFDGVVTAKPIVQHRFYDRKRKKWNGDRATTPVSADGMIDRRHSTGLVRPGLKTRFGSHLREYERYLVESGQDIPLDFLGDKVYPETLKTMLIFGILTIQELAGATDGQLKQVSEAMGRQKQPLQARRIHEFRDFARARLEELGAGIPNPPSPKPARQKQAAA